MGNTKSQGFKIEKGYGLILNIEENTISYFKNSDPIATLSWPKKQDNKLLPKINLKSEEDLKLFMVLILQMFSGEKLLIRKINVNKDYVAVYYYC